MTNWYSDYSKYAVQPMDINNLQQMLLKQREMLTGIGSVANEAAATVELDQTRVGRLSRMDAMQAQAMSIATNQRRRQQLRRIEAALKRIEDDEYGDCLHCGESIAPSRLRIDPAATLCIGCAEQAER